MNDTEESRIGIDVTKKLTDSQERIYNAIMNFLGGDDKIYLLKGYAGTGKTTLVRSVIKELGKQSRKFALLAPTGRAAKVLRDMTGIAANTIHATIYNFNRFNQDVSKIETEADVHGQLYLIFSCSPQIIDTEDQKDDERDDMVYIVDEASMISDNETQNFTQALFGSGKVLYDLLSHDKRTGAKYIFIGDPCQLPPINEIISPALSANYLKSRYHLSVQEGQLTEIIRQGETNEIIHASKLIRTLWKNAPDSRNAYNGSNYRTFLPFRKCKNIVLHNTFNMMTDNYCEKIQYGDYNSATCIVQSNKRAAEVSSLLRNKLGRPEHDIVPNDLLLVIQNNALFPLTNGDMVTVEDIMPKETAEHRAGLTFRKVRVKNTATGISYSTLLLEDTIHLNILNLSQKMQTSLFVDFILRMKKKGIKEKDELHKAMSKDPYLNALRCVFGYAITCYKSQGGEWDEVYMDIGKYVTINPTKSTYQWIYTAMTRAKKYLHVVNDFYLESMY